MPGVLGQRTSIQYTSLMIWLARAREHGSPIGDTHRTPPAKLNLKNRRLRQYAPHIGNAKSNTQISIDAYGGSLFDPSGIQPALWVEGVCILAENILVPGEEKIQKSLSRNF